MNKVEIKIKKNQITKIIAVMLISGNLPLDRDKPAQNDKY